MGNGRASLVVDPGHRRHPREQHGLGEGQRLEGNKRQRGIKETRAGSLIWLLMWLSVGFGDLLVKTSIF